MNLPKSLLVWAIRQFPAERVETGAALLAEFEELHGWEALEWALGSVKLAFVWNGGRTMKHVGYWVAVVGVAAGAGWAYTHGSLVLGFFLIALGTGFGVYARPSAAIPAVIVFASSLPLAQLITVYTAMQGIFGGQVGTAGDVTMTLSGNFQLNQTAVQSLQTASGRVTALLDPASLKPINAFFVTSSQSDIPASLTQLLPWNEVGVLALVIVVSLTLGWLLSTIRRRQRVAS